MDDRGTFEELFGLDVEARVTPTLAGFAALSGANPAEKYKARAKKALEGWAERQGHKDEGGSIKAARAAREAVLDGYDPGRDEVKEPRRRVDHNERTRNLFEGRGYVVKRVDYFDHLTKRHHDFLGFGDLIAISHELRIVQLTSIENIATRMKKILESSLARAWLRSGGKISVVGWRKHVSSGGAISYTPEEREVV